jgi:GDPmannose 4,6-dehydratase
MSSKIPKVVVKAWGLPDADYKKSAVVTGAGGQDGSYLCEYLLGLGYEVHGTVRHKSGGDPENRLEKCLNNPDFRVHTLDITDRSAVDALVGSVFPDELYHLAAMSHVGVSFSNPTLTFDTNVTGTLNVLESVRHLSPLTRVYFAGTSEMFGGAPGTAPQSESTPMRPKSPYAISKLAGFNLCQIYRSSYGLYVACGILFNHESSRRGKLFVTRKITRAVAEIVAGDREFVELGNIDAVRDWGHAKDYVQAMHEMLQLNADSNKGVNLVIGTGRTNTVREFADAAFSHVGIHLEWSTEGELDVAFDAYGKKRVVSNPNLFRPTECSFLEANPTMAKIVIGWEVDPEAFEKLVAEMVDSDVDEVKIENAVAGVKERSTRGRLFGASPVVVGALAGLVVVIAALA